MWRGVIIRVLRIRARVCFTFRISGFPLLLLAIFLLPAAAQTPSGTAAAGAETQNFIWFADNTSARQIDVTTDRITQMIPLAHAARALAVDASGHSLWVLSYTHLLKFDAQTSLILDLDLENLLSESDGGEDGEEDGREQQREIKDADKLLLNPYDGSVWVGSRKVALHLDSQGKVLFAWRALEGMEAMALSLDESLWVLDKNQLRHLSPAGAVLNSYPTRLLAGDKDRHFRLLAIDSLNGILWLMSNDTLFQTNLADLVVKPVTQIYPVFSPTSMNHREEREDGHDQEVVGLTLDPVDGSVWVMTNRTLLHFDRAGTLLATLVLRPQGLQDMDILVFDAPTESLWLGGKKSLAHFSNTGALVAKIPLEASLSAVGVTPFKLTPGIALVQPLPDGLSNNAKLPIHLALSAVCDTTPCSPNPAYFNAFSFNATVNGAPIGNLFSNIQGEAIYLPAERYPEGMNIFSVQARDGFGHSTNTLTGRFTIDTVPPDIRLETPTVSLTRTPAQMFSGSVSEPASLVLNDQPVLLDPSRRFAQQVTLKEGLNTFTLTATDLAGNAAQRAVALVLDTVPPRFLNLTPADGSLFTTPDIAVQGALDDATATIAVEDLTALNGEIISADPGHFSFKLHLKSGANTVSLVAQDPAGNAARVSLHFTYSTGSLTVANLTPGATVDSNATPVMGSFDGPLNTGITVNGIVASTYGNRFFVNNVPLQPGENTLTIIATTLEGTAATQTLTINSAGAGGITIERVPPGDLTAINTVAGTGMVGFTGDDGPALQARLSSPGGIDVGADGSLYIADSGNYRIRKVDVNGVVTTVAGNGIYSYNGDHGPARQAAIGNPIGVTAGPDGGFYLVDGFNHVRKVDASGVITTIAGNGVNDFAGDNGPAIDASLSYPYALAIDKDGGLYINDAGNSRIRKVDANGIITTVIGNGDYGYSGDNGPAIEASLASPSGIAFGPDGSLYIADWGNSRIRKVDVNGIITTVAGNGDYGYSGDGQPATQARLAAPIDVKVGLDGSLYIADGDNYNIRKVDPQGIITTLAGNGIDESSGDGGSPRQASLGYPISIALSSDGTLYVADSDTSRIRAFTTLTATGASAPLLVGFKLSNNTGNAIQKIEADFDGDGVIDFTTTNPAALLQHDYTKPGIYTATFTETDSTNTVHVATYVVVIADPQQQDVLFTNLWGGMNDSLTQGDLNTAMKYLNISAKQKYQPVLQTLLTHMQAIVAAYSPLLRSSVTEDIGEYAVIRNVNGRKQLFLIYFVRDPDGVWRLDGM